jgi:hypothetical protein
MIKLPGEKVIKELYEARVIQQQNEAVTKKLLDISEKERNGIMEDPEKIKALIKQLKDKTPIVPIELEPHP